MTTPSPSKTDLSSSSSTGRPSPPPFEAHAPGAPVAGSFELPQHIKSSPPKPNNGANSGDTKKSLDEIKESTEEESTEDYVDDDPWYPYRDGYTRKVIRRKYMSWDDYDENFDENAWHKKAYGENVIVLDTHGVPDGWILVDGNAPSPNDRWLSLPHRL